MTSRKLAFLSVFALALVKHSVLSDEVANPPSEGYGLTYVEVEQIKYNWTIENFSLLPQNYGEDLRSPIFCDRNNETEWRIQLFPRGYTSKEAVGLFLILQSHRYGKGNATASWEMSIIKRGAVQRTITEQHSFRPTTGWGHSEYISRSTLLNISKPDDTFTIRLEIKLPRKVITGPYNASEPLEEEMIRDLESNRLNQDFNQLFKEPKFSDLVIVASNESFKAHKVILGTRSPVFAAHFEAEMSAGNDSKQMIIENLEPTVVKAMLEFLYTDQVTDIKNLAYGLLEVADKFKLPRLKTMCELVLYRALNESNAADLLILTDLYHAYTLKEHIMKFIGNHISTVMNSEGYGRLEKNSPRLALELFRTITNKSSTI